MKTLQVDFASIAPILVAIDTGENYERDGYYIVNHIGMTTYISYDHLTADELRAIARYKDYERES